jgi:ABC-type dipeptide/oligopeptide/nickel transport system ATPase component
MKDIEENLFLQDIKESGLKAEEGCYCQVCQILRRINKVQQEMADKIKVITDKIDKEIEQMAYSDTTSNPYTKGFRDSIPARRFIKEDIRPISGNLYDEQAKITIESFNCRCKVDPIG